MAREEQAQYDALSEAARAAASAPLKPLKLIIMSATLRVEDFTANPRLFTHPPPVLRAESRQYPVSIHFSRKTAMDDYLEQTFKKVCKIHKRLPAGGILVFLTGKGEILHMCQRLRRELGVKKKGKGVAEGERKKEVRNEEKAEDPKEEGEEGRVVREMDDDEEDAGVQDGERDDYEVMEREEEENGGGKGSDESGAEEEEEEDKAEGGEKDGQEAEAMPIHVLPLFAMLPPSEQARVFRPPPPGHRLIVIATNVAETSVTIPGIKYVVDCGRVKARTYDHASGISQFQVQWVSQASADQRAGRAGRTGGWNCRDARGKGRRT